MAQATPDHNQVKTIVIVVSVLSSLIPNTVRKLLNVAVVAPRR